MGWRKMGIKELKRRAIFLIVTLTIMSANLALAVEIDPISLAQQTEKMGIVGVLMVVIAVQATGLLYLLRIISTNIVTLVKKSIETNERVIDAIDHCKSSSK